MGVYLDGVIESIKHSFNAQLWLRFLIIGLLSFVVSGIFLVFFFAISGIFLSSILQVSLFDFLTQFFSGTGNSMVFEILGSLSNPGIFQTFVLLTAVLGIIFLVISTLIDSFFQAVIYCLTRTFLRTGRLSFSEAFSNAKKRFFVLFQAKLVVTGIIMLIAVIIFSPVFFSLNLLLQSQIFAGAPASLTSVFASFLGTLFLFLLFSMLFCLVLLFIAPYFAMLAPIVLFENSGVIDSVKRSVALLKDKYWSSWGFLVFLTVIVAIISLFYAAIGFLLWIFSALIILLLLLRWIIDLVFMAWLSSATTIAFVVLYEINSAKEKKGVKKFFKTPK